MDIIMLCGPITGNRNTDWPLFRRYQKKLRKQGIEAINPLTVINNYRKNYPDLVKKSDQTILKESAWQLLLDIRICLDLLTRANVIYLIPGWESDCIGSIICYAALALNLKVIQHDENGRLIYLTEEKVNEQGGLSATNDSKEEEIGYDEDEDGYDDEEGDEDDEEEEYYNDEGLTEINPNHDLGAWFEKQFKKRDG